MTDWQKIDKAPYYLEVWQGPYRTTYRVNWRSEGHDLRRRLKGDFKTWKDALKEADRLISEARFGKKKPPKAFIRCEELCDEIVKLKESKAPATYQQAEIFFRVHIKPFLNEYCAYAADLNPTVWENYKNALRLKNPTVRLFNHWKYMVMLFKYAFQKGLLDAPVKLAFSEEREDFRERGHVIPLAEIQAILKAANRTWRDRITLQWRTGMRPGEVRNLSKDRVRLTEQGAVISLRREDTKTRLAREFLVTAPDAVAVLRERMEGDSPYFFPMETDHTRPMDKHMTGWNTALKKVFDPDEKRLPVPAYTPHDIRHTYATAMFQQTKNHIALCYQLGMSLEEAQKTYLHIGLKDTADLAQIASQSELNGDET